MFHEILHRTMYSQLNIEWKLFHTFTYVIRSVFGALNSLALAVHVLEDFPRRPCDEFCCLHRTWRFQDDVVKFDLNHRHAIGKQQSKKTLAPKFVEYMSCHLCDKQTRQSCLKYRRERAWLREELLSEVWWMIRHMTDIHSVQLCTAEFLRVEAELCFRWILLNKIPH